MGGRVAVELTLVARRGHHRAGRVQHHRADRHVAVVRGGRAPGPGPAAMAASHWLASP